MFPMSLKAPTVNQTEAASDLKPVECWKPTETLCLCPPPVTVGALKGGFHMYESDRQYTFKKSTLTAGPQTPLSRVVSNHHVH